MLSKKAQLTLYLILGLLILIIAVFTARKVLRIETAEVPTDLLPAKEYLQRCLVQSLDDGVREVALRGGYLEPPSSVTYHLSFVNDAFIFPYYFKDGQQVVPAPATVAANVGTAARAALQGCIANASTIKGYTFNVPTAPKLDIVIHPDAVTAELVSAIEITGETSVYRTSAFSGSVPLPLGEMLSVATEITNIQSRDPTRWCLSCIGDLQPLHTTIQPDFIAGAGETLLLYRLVQRNASLPLIFLFAHRLPHREIPKTLAMPEIDTLETHAAVPFTYALPKWDNVLYTDDSPLFDIDPFTGTIAFTPEHQDVGEYVTTITMKAPNGDFTQESFILEVIA